MRIPLLLTLATLLLGCGASPRPTLPPLTHNPMDRYRFGCEPIDSAYVAAHLDELEELFGSHLTADTYRDKLLAALAFYPRLRGVNIELRQRVLRTSMAARPVKLGSTRSKRRYAILVDDISTKAHDFRHTSYSAQVGCFIHELGHVSHYERTANLDLIGEASAYVTNQRFKSRYEAIADSFVVRNGGGYFLYEYRRHTFEEADLPAEYLAFKERNYNTHKAVLRQHRRYLKKRGWENRCQHSRP